MKTSNKILLAAVSALVVLAVISIISMRVMVDRAAEAGGNFSAIDRTYDEKTGHKKTTPKLLDVV
ncbi:MAG: hypothetical protein U5P10_05990 [Spirochaetia bacterium]|nr:hypothetical protein [Spirochaetia bacterium]